MKVVCKPPTSLSVSIAFPLTITHIRDGTSFRLTSIYGPSRHSRKEAFFTELVAQKPPVGTMWLANGDFNQIYRALDKKKRTTNQHRINRFRDTLQLCELSEIHLQNRRSRCILDHNLF
jgi:hypothetical protein